MVEGEKVIIFWIQTEKHLAGGMLTKAGIDKAKLTDALGDGILSYEEGFS